MPRRSGRPLIAVFLLGACLCGCQRESPPPPPEAEVQPLGPRLSMAVTTSSAGDVDYGVARDYSFEVANQGDRPLHLKLLRKSCLCADVTLPAAAIDPGKQDTIVLRWAPIPGSVGPYTFSTTLETNDPLKPTVRLEVQGNINPLVRFHPENISFVDFATLRHGAIAEREVKVISTRLDYFELAASLSSPGFQAITTPLQPGDVVGGATIKSGYGVTIKTTDHLPHGYVRADIAFDIRVPDQPPRTLAMAIYGEVEQGIFQVTPREVEFHKEKVTEADTRKVLVRFFVPSENEELLVVKCEPAFLKCDPPRRLSNLLWEVAIHLPADNPDAARYQADGFFEGRIVFKASSNPNEVPVRVKWRPK